MKDIFQEIFENTFGKDFFISKKRYWYDYLFDGDNWKKREGFNLEDIIQFYELEKELETGGVTHSA